MAPKLHDWQVQGKKLARHFHETVRPQGEGAFCAYCDGLLGAQSPETIDHWVPRERCPELALWWGNLFPACYSCQSEKRTKWSPGWLRPDLEDVERLLDCLETGRLRPAPEITDAPTRERVERTIDDLGLNRHALCRERQRMLKDLATATPERLLLLAQDGPYRFLARRLVGLP